MPYTTIMLRSWTKMLAPYQLTDDVKKAMYSEYRYLMYMGGLFLCLEPKIAVFSVLQNISGALIVVFNGFCIIVSAFRAPTIVSLAQYLNYLTLSIINLGIFFSALHNRGSIIRILEIVSVDFYDYGESFNNQEAAEWKRNLRTFKIIVFLVIPAYLGCVAFSLMFRETIDLMFGYELSEEDYDNEGIYQKSPIKLWYPFYINGEVGRIFITLTLIISGGVHALSIGCADVLLLFLGATLNLQTRILHLAAVKMEERARSMYSKESSRNPSTDEPSKITEDHRLLDVCYKRCIKQVIQHHIIIQDFYRNCNSLAKWPTALVISAGSVTIAMSVLAFIVGYNEVPSTLINAGLLLVGEISSILILCEIGQRIRYWSERLSGAMYEIDWLNMSPSNKRMLLIFNERTKRPMALLAGGLVPVDRNTFKKIMNSAYTYVNLFMASDAQQGINF